jgi:fructoselysine-6-P-deglycase FrlB-like protein
MHEMVDAEPELARSIVTDRPMGEALAAEVLAAAAAGTRIVVVGCGTSEHAALAVAALLDEALAARGRTRGTVVARQAFEAAIEPWPAGLLIAISHEAETMATMAALGAASAAGTRTALITANRDGIAASLADVVLATPLLDRSWCHTVGYLSPVLLGSAAAAVIGGGPLDGDQLAGAMAVVAGHRAELDRLAGALGGATAFVIVGSGLDYVAARELALKIEEGVRLPAVARDTETELHGHLVSARPTTALIAIAADPRRGDARARRAAQLLLAASRLGMPTAAIVGDDGNVQIPDAATSALRIVLPFNSAASRVGSLAQIAATSGVALQCLTLALIVHHGTNPDRIGRENDDQRESAAIASESFPF